MFVSFSLVDSVLKTLPVGYYFGTKADVELTNEPITYCCPTENKIYISYPMIKELMEPIEKDTAEELEADIRCLLYHELSHLILTPPKLSATFFSCSLIGDIEARAAYYKNNLFRDAFYEISHDIINIVEDQRIETMLKDFYHGVDFPKFVYKVNGKPGKPSNTFELIFEAVRYNYGPEKLVKIANDIINTYTKKEALKFRDWQEYYVASIFVLWYYADKYFEASKKPTMSESASDESKIESSGKENLSASGTTTGSEKESSPEDCLPENVEVTTEELLHAATTPITGELAKTYVRNMAKKKLTYGLDTVIEQQIDKIISKALSKKASFGGANSGYSGAVDPRLCGSRDYRWFIKSGDSLENRFSKVKLNLFIDVSGSFSPSQDTINNLIRALIIAEDKFKDFTFDVVKMSCCDASFHRNENDTPDSNFVAKKENRFVKCAGGNRLDKTIFPCFKQVQDATARNYNIVVFDGDAWSDTDKANRECIKVFNTPNTIIISDTDNEYPIKKWCKQSRNILVENEYAKLLKDNVLKTLEAALA